MRWRTPLTLSADEGDPFVYRPLRVPAELYADR
jgi:hypothetical protein